MDYKKTMEYLSILLDMEKNIYIQVSSDLGESFEDKTFKRGN